MNEEAAKKLREPFPPEAIGKLPKGGTTLDYVGHAAVTDRLLEVDPEWNWEPLAFTEDGAPLIRRDGKDAVLWIKLTIAGTTRYGVGIVGGTAFELEKQLISDALRNAAMRFGVALDLWSKEDFRAETPADPYSQTAKADARGPVRGPDEEPTSKGNTRRGPRVLEGWADYAEQKAAHDAYAELGKAQPEEVQAAVKAWTAEQGYGWPMAKAELEATTAQLTALVNAHFGSCPSCGEPITEENPADEEHHGCAACAPM